MEPSIAFLSGYLRKLKYCFRETIIEGAATEYSISRFASHRARSYPSTWGGVHWRKVGSHGNSGTRTNRSFAVERSKAVYWCRKFNPVEESCRPSTRKQRAKIKGKWVTNADKERQTK